MLQKTHFAQERLKFIRQVVQGSCVNFVHKAQNMHSSQQNKSRSSERLFLIAVYFYISVTISLMVFPGGIMGRTLTSGLICTSMTTGA